MNPSALLDLVSDLYAQLTSAQQRVLELERQLAALQEPIDENAGGN